MTNLVIIKDNQAMTTSRMVAEAFEKQHKDVLRSIENLGCSPEFHQRNFAPMFYTSELGNGATRQDKEIDLTRDGFTFLAMGYTGKKAAQFKEAYIKAFNEMEATLKNTVSLENKYTIEDLIIAQATSIKELKEEVQAMQVSMKAVAHPLILEAGQTQLFPSEVLISVSEFTKNNSYSNTTLSYIGRLATQHSKRCGFKFEKRKNGNLYCKKALDASVQIALNGGNVMQIPTLNNIATPVSESKEIKKIIELLKKNPLAQELKNISVGKDKSYRSYMLSTLKNIIYLKIHKCSNLRFSIKNSSRGWLKVQRLN